MAISSNDDENSVVTYRGGIVENTHQIHAAVTDCAGSILFYVGNPNRLTLIRSAAKPLQALAVLETGGPQQYGFDAGDVALMCASHNSEHVHVSRARSMLNKVGAGALESHLMCGGHDSIDPEITRSWNRHEYTPTRINNNCSGKHVGMLAGCRAIGAPFEGYHLQSHPVQSRVAKVVEEVTGLSPGEVYWGVDGCNMPAPAIPLHRLSKAFAHFAQAADDDSKPEATATGESVLQDRTHGKGVKGRGESSSVGSRPASSVLAERTALSASVFDAMAHHADMVAGRGRFCTVLMEAFEGALIGKVGADGCYGVGVRGSEYMAQHLGLKGALGIAVKVGDGNLDVLYAVVSELIERLGLGSPEARKKLDRFHHPSLKNTMGVVIGEMSFPFTLRKC